MGTYKDGIKGSFSGKIGPVIGAKWKQTDYMRSLPRKNHNPSTLGQLKQQSKFRIMMLFLLPINEYLRTGYKLFIENQTPLNAAIQYNIKNAITGTYPNFAIKYDKVLTSRGLLPNAKNITIRVEANRIVIIRWECDRLDPALSSADFSMIAIINAIKAQAIFTTHGMTRAHEQMSIQMPHDWVGDSAELYISFISQNEAEVSNSEHINIAKVIN
ncbi:hypothetical protein FACS1894199_16440 [Bacteroidia bacterium]|nr:hypothetical protein FACS1894199_16440 [Bacteroidia bacterium]